MITTALFIYLLFFDNNRRILDKKFIHLGFSRLGFSLLPLKI
jgi:hypothetical protein